MEKAITSALAIVIFMSSAAAGPIQMNDKELDLIYGGNGSSLQFSLVNNRDGSAVFIYNDVEHEMTIGSSLSLPDGTKVQIKQQSNGYTTIVTKGEITVSELVAIIGSSATTNVTFPLIKIEGVSACTGSGCK
jgi:uncharacterized protein YdgA (DUF945 family)